MIYYNENDPRAVRWLRYLLAQGLIPEGEIDDRDIRDVSPWDVAGYTQCHFFAGIGGWACAARLAGWPDDKPLWSASCPCQPFSVAGKGRGTADARHLWPDLLRLAGPARPPVIVGEQVAGKAGRGWFHGVRTDLENLSYAVRAVDIPACGVNAPHIRNRLYWLGSLEHAQGDGRGEGWTEHELRGGRHPTAHPDGAMGNTDSAGLALGRGQSGDPRSERSAVERTNGGGMLGDTTAPGEGRGLLPGSGESPVSDGGRPSNQPSGSDGNFWDTAEWLQCHDGKARRAQPGTPLLVDGLPGRVALWRGLGNAICVPLAAEVLKAYLETE